MDATASENEQNRAHPNGAGVSRRAFLAASAAAAGGVAAAGALGGGSAAAADAAAPEGLTYSPKDLKHVVILMEENRSFDHYFGMLPGVRGFGDKQALQLRNGLSVFHQPDAARSDGGYLLPFHMDSSKMNALIGWDLAHGWVDSHAAWNNGAFDGWVAAKGELTMGYYTDDDIPWWYDMVSQYTLCDHYHCSTLTSTHPNRYYNWIGSIDPNGTGGGPRLDNSAATFSQTWTTYAEVLQAAGVDWGTFVSQTSNGSWGQWWSNNMVEYFAQFKTYALSSDPALKEIAQRGQILLNSSGSFAYPDDPLYAPVANLPAQAMSDASVDLQPYFDVILKDFDAACAQTQAGASGWAEGGLPAVSWMASPGNWSDHPGTMDAGAVYVDAVMKVMAKYPDVWNSTLFIINYDEADGLFDHVQTPFPEPGETDEFVPTALAYPDTHHGPLHIGFGMRVPCVLVSPWTRGGKVFSESADHTSVHQFVERWLYETGQVSDIATVRNPNITAWRRRISSDLWGAFDWANPDFSVPTLIDPQPLLRAITLGQSLPKAAPPPVGQQSMPTPHVASGVVMTPLPTRYLAHAAVTVDHTSGTVTATMTNAGTQAINLQVLPEIEKTFAATPYDVVPGTPRTYVWDATETGGRYAFSIYGPDRFVRSFAGAVLAADDNLAGVPSVDAQLITTGSKVVRLTLGNDGLNPLRYDLVPHDYAGSEQSVFVEPGTTTTIDWPLDPHGYYDVIVTDSSDTGFRQRYAGRIN